MSPDEIELVSQALGSAVAGVRPLAGGFSHETCLLTLADRQVVVRLGGPDPAIEAAVLAAAAGHVPVPTVVGVLDVGRPATVLECVAGTPCDEVLAGDVHDPGGLGAEIGRVVAGCAAITFDRPGFFADDTLAVTAGPPWSRQLPEFAATGMAAAARLPPATRDAWTRLCAAHAPALARIDGQARLVHADCNPKNLLVTSTTTGWRVDAVLDWEFAFAGCPYADAANLLRFAADCPPDFVAGFRAAFAEHQPADLPPPTDWAYLGRVMDMFALTDLVTRPLGHPIADRAAEVIGQWVATGVPDDINRRPGR
jgi:aminoglycoside phosphotransferase (APT) family kinase protein